VLCTVCAGVIRSFEQQEALCSKNEGSENAGPSVGDCRCRLRVCSFIILETLWAEPRGLLGGHLNIRSLLSKSEQIQHLLLGSNLDFLCLSETWLNQNAPLAALNIPGYNIYRTDRQVSKKGGGVMVYIRSTLQCHKIQWSNCNLECLGLNVRLSPQMSLL